MKTTVKLSNMSNVTPILSPYLRRLSNVTLDWTSSAICFRDANSAAFVVWLIHYLL